MGQLLGLVGFRLFAELKRSRPQLRGLGVEVDDPGLVDDWHGGSRRTQR